MKQINGLDTLRAFAVFLVIMQHFGVWFSTTAFPGQFIHDVLIPDGGYGVTLFFVLSGFLITSILLKAKGISVEGNDRFFIIKNFFIRRSLRIFPIYYLLILVLFLTDYPDVRHYITYFATYTSNILFYRTNTWNGLSHTWSLAIEEQFYLLWPWLILFLKNKYLKYIFPAAIITGIVTTYITLANGHMHPFLVYNFFDAFGIGGLYAYARLNTEWNKTTTIINVAAFISLLIYFYWKFGVFYGHPVHCLFMEKTVNSILALWLIMRVINSTSVWVRKYILDNRFLNFIGKISYGIYLYHYVYNVALLGLVNNFLKIITANHYRINLVIMDPHFNYWIHIVLIVFISVLSYLFIERPLLKLKRFFIYNKHELAMNT